MYAPKLKHNGTSAPVGHSSLMGLFKIRGIIEKGRGAKRKMIDIHGGVEGG